MENESINNPITPESPISQTNESNGWSWTTAFLFIFVLIGTRRWGLAALVYILLFIPLINILTMIACFIYGGLNGKKLIWTAKNLNNNDEKRGALKFLTSNFIFMLIATLIAFYYCSLLDSISLYAFKILITHVSIFLQKFFEK